jgi:hypothetical protein
MMRPGSVRLEHEPPAAVAEQGWRYHHLGVPTETPRPGERYLEQYGMWVSGFETSPYGIEWMRFDDDSPISELVRTVPHLAFEVDQLESALQGKEVLVGPESLGDGIRMAMIIDDGAPIELLEFHRGDG